MATYDLDGDGKQERVVILANIAISPDGNEEWDDGQQWEVRIEGMDGTRTRVYAQYIQSGRLRGYITKRREVPILLLLQETSAGIREFEIEYRGPGKFRSQLVFTRSIEQSIDQPVTIHRRSSGR